MVSIQLSFIKDLSIVGLRLVSYSSVSWLVYSSFHNFCRAWELRETFTPSLHRWGAMACPQAMHIQGHTAQAPGWLVASEEINAELLSWASSHQTLLVCALTQRKCCHSENIQKTCWSLGGLEKDDTCPVRCCCLVARRGRCSAFSLEKRWKGKNHRALCSHE